MIYKDYYQILGVARNANQADIKKAYRNLARKYHPDVSKEKDAEARFKEVAEAYETLKNDEKRAAYDQLGRHRAGEEFRPPPSWAHHFEGANFAPEDLTEMDLSDLFSIFSDARLRGAARGAGRRGAGLEEDLHAEAHLTLEEAARGTEVQVDIPLLAREAFAPEVFRREPLRVRIPKGVKEGDRLRVQRPESRSHASGGDLFLHIKFRPHPLFKVHQHDLYLEAPIAPWESALRTSIEIPTLDGRVSVKLPAGARSGQKLRLSGKGLPKSDGSAGDLYAILQIAVPSNIGENERALWAKLAEQSHFAPRAHFEVGYAKQSE